MRSLFVLLVFTYCSHFSQKLHYDFPDITQISLIDTLKWQYSLLYKDSDKSIIDAGTSKLLLVEKLYDYLISEKAEIPLCSVYDTTQKISPDAIKGLLTCFSELRLVNDSVTGFRLTYQIDFLRNYISRLKFLTPERIQYYSDHYTGLREKIRSIEKLKSTLLSWTAGGERNVLLNTFDPLFLSLKEDVTELFATLQFYNGIANHATGSDLYDAKETFEFYMKLFPDDLLAKSTIAYAMRIDEEYALSVNIYFDIFERNGDRESLYLNLARLFQDMGEIKKSLKFVQKCSDSDDKYTLLGNSYFRLGIIDTAFNYWEQAYALDTLSPATRHNLLVSYALKKDTLNYSRLLQDNMEHFIDPVTLFYIGHRKMAERLNPGIRDSAVPSELLKYVNMDKYESFQDSVNGYQNIARLYNQMGYLDKALTYIDSAISLIGDIKRPDIYETKANILFALQEYEEAASCMEWGMASECDKNIFYSKCSFESGDVDDAISFAEEALELNPDSRDANFAITKYLIFEGEYSDAYKYALTAGNKDWEFVSLLALTEYRLGKKKSALSKFEEALENNPLDLFMLKSYAQILKEEGRVNYSNTILSRVPILSE